ncbi:MAG: ABC transporter substrate-binding protein [Candidatus Hodarchaeota archaeon]
MKSKKRIASWVLLTAMLLVMGGISAQGTKNVTASTLQDTLVVLYPHSSEFAEWVFDDFKAWYKAETGKSITISSILEDSAASYEKVATWNGTDPEADIWWGGGVFWFDQGTAGDLLEGYTVVGDNELIDEFGGWAMKGALKDGKHTWYAAALSGFGFMWNTEYLAANGLDIPFSWLDLTDHQYMGHIFMADSKASGSTVAAIKQQLQARPYEEAWALWAQIAANIATFGSSSGSIREEVAAGTYGIGIVIDYYYYQKVTADAPVGFSFGGATTVSPDPGGIIKNAKNMEQAQKFMDYLVSVRGQTRVGKYRPPIRADATPTPPVLNAFDPLAFPAIPGFDPVLDSDIHSRARDVFHHWLIVNHDAAVTAWAEMGKAYGKHAAAIHEFTKVPENVATMDALAAVDYHDPAVLAGWEEHGSNQFNKALNAAKGITTPATTVTATVTTTAVPELEVNGVFALAGLFAVPVIIPIILRKRKK